MNKKEYIIDHSKEIVSAVKSRKNDILFDLIKGLGEEVVELNVEETKLIFLACLYNKKALKILLRKNIIPHFSIIVNAISRDSKKTINTLFDNKILEEKYSENYELHSNILFFLNLSEKNFECQVYKKLTKGNVEKELYSFFSAFEIISRRPIFPGIDFYTAKKNVIYFLEHKTALFNSEDVFSEFKSIYDVFSAKSGITSGVKPENKELIIAMENFMINREKSLLSSQIQKSIPASISRF